MNTICLDCKRTSKNELPACWFCWSKNTFYMSEDTTIKETYDIMTDYFLEEFNINK